MKIRIGATKMKATESRIEDFLQTAKTKFIIPIYQREYRWEIAHCQQLLDDIVEVAELESEDAHFIGSIVYVADGIYTTSKMKELSIVDGQQRLTTLFIIYLVIYRIAIEMDNESLADDIYENYLTNKTAPENDKLKLQTDEENIAAIKLLMRGEGKSFIGKSRIIDNFNFFKKNINEANVDTILIGLLKIAFVEVSLDRARDNPQKIFESLNSTGLDLSQDDLIRNYILMGLTNEQQEIIFEGYWEQIDTLARDETKDQSKLFDFMKAYLTTVNSRVPHNNKVYKEFKSSFVFSDFNELESKLTPIRVLVGYYNKITNPQNETDKDLRAELYYIKQLDVGVIHPFLMKIYEDYAKDVLSKDDFLVILRLVQSYMIRRFIVGLATSALLQMFMSLYEKIDKDDYLESLQVYMVSRKTKIRFPKDKEVVDILKHRDVYNANSRNKTYLLDRLENFNNKEPVSILDNPDITIEHIFPQTPNRQWNEQLTAVDFDLFKDTYLHTLGNLTLSGNNGSLGNKDFIYKRDLPEKGYSASRLWLNKYLSDINSWDIAAFESRFDILSAKFLQIWPFPEVEIIEGDVNFEEINVFDVGDPTGKKMEYFVFLGEAGLERTSVGMLIHVLKKLYKMDSSLILSSNVIDRVSITRESERLRSPVDIGDGNYIEAYRSASSILATIKYLLILFGLHEALYIKYESETEEF